MLASYFLIAQQYQAVPYLDLFLTAIIPVLIGYFIFYYGVKLEFSGWSGIYKWIGLLPVLLGIVLTYQKFSLILDPVYRFAFYIGKKEIILNVIAFLIPIAGFLGLFIWAAKIMGFKDE